WAEAREALASRARSKGFLQQPVDELTAWAQIARRCGSPIDGARWLKPRVRDATGAFLRGVPGPTLLEYAALLADLGAFREADALLERVAASPDPPPELGQYVSLIRYRQWDWVTALPWLDRMIAHPRVGEYARKVAKVNRITGRWRGEQDPGGAISELREFERALDPEKERLLWREIPLIEAGCWSDLRKTREALIAYDEAEKRIQAGGPGQFKLHVEANRWCTRLQVPTERAKLLKGHGRLRERLIEAERWHILRSVDVEYAREARDALWMNHALLGTPSPRARERMLRAPLALPDLPQGHALALRETGPPDPVPYAGDSEFLQVWNGVSSASDRVLKEGFGEQRTLQALCADFYQPASALALHEHLFPREFFNPASSFNRVHQAVSRLNRWLKAARLPFSAEKVAGGYRLAGPGTPYVRVKPEAEVKEELVPLRLRKRLEKVWGETEGGEIGPAGVMKALGVSRRLATEILREGVESGMLKAEGAGRGRKYRRP
ncbi:MAG: hypothetical protein IT285_10070, partial [Bdellovibrionales bacterium]|nr:hypothetical protein [Bdellovibrionales bacterium]